MKTQFMLVEAIQQYRMRYVVKVPVNEDFFSDLKAGEVSEFSQQSLGETIVSHRILSEKELLTLCDEDNDYSSTWTKEQKLEVFVSNSINKVIK